MKLAKIEAWLIGYVWFIIYHLPLIDLMILNYLWHFKDKGHKKYKFLSLKYLNDYEDFINYGLYEIDKAKYEYELKHDRAVQYWRNWK